MASFEGPNYENGIDFKALAKSDPEFAAIYSANNSWVDFKNSKAVKYCIWPLLRPSLIHS